MVASLAPLRPPASSPMAIPQDLAEQLFEAADAEERGHRPIVRSIDLLRRAGLLTDHSAVVPTGTARALMKVASANLSVGRLWEGHVNALLLLDLYGTARQTERMHRLVANGAFLGVWGADGNVPVTFDASKDRLKGCKRFASGLGAVTHALVTVDAGPEVRLALIDVTCPKRADPETWNTLGMKATASGTYDFNDLSFEAFEWVGAPGNYLQEPHFVGGVWRIAALQVGAAIGLLDRAAAQLRAMNRMEAEPQKARLMTVLARAWAGVALVERAAEAASDSDEAPEQIVSLSIAARLFTEEVALDAIRAVEQSLGLQHFDGASDTGRMARDLSVYLRQAARDAFLQRAATSAFGQEGQVWGVFE